MPNPFNLQNTNPMMQMANVYKMLSSSNNPTQLFRQMAEQNPQMRPVVDLLNKGYNPEQIFNNMCEQRGIDPKAFISQITGNNT